MYAEDHAEVAIYLDVKVSRYALHAKKCKGTPYRGIAVAAQEFGQVADDELCKAAAVGNLKVHQAGFKISKELERCELICRAELPMIPNGVSLLR